MRHLLLGMFMIALGLWGITTWWDAFAFAMRAFVPLFALIWGVLAVLSSYARLGFTSRRRSTDDDIVAED